MWLGYWNGRGVYQFNPEDKSFKNYLSRNGGVTSIYIDSNDVLWVGTLNGLYKYNPNIDNFIPFTTSGLAANIPQVRSIVEDNQKNLWLTTNNQIVKINPERNEVSYFGQNYGVGQSTFNYLAGYKKNNGEIYFGDATGYFSFFADEFLGNLKTPEIIFTNFHLSDKIIKPGDGGPLYENLNEQKEIKLQYNQNVFSFDFTIADYANPAQNSLNYYLENYDFDWRIANAERKAYYFNVPPGKYVFHLKGVNSYGAWAEKTIDIIIMPPWWQNLASLWNLCIVIYCINFWVRSNYATTYCAKRTSENTGKGTCTGKRN